MLVPFGKHKGEPVERVPRSYLHWMLTNTRLTGELLAEVRHVLYGDPKPQQVDVDALIADTITPFEASE